MTPDSPFSRVVIAGAGHAASEFVGSLRQGGFRGQILMLGDEPHLPYQRPPLSKGFLSGEVDFQALQLKPQASYDKIDVEVRRGTCVSGIDRGAKHVTLSNGTLERYDNLILATGGRPRTLAIPGLERTDRLSNLHYLRTIHDAERLRHQFQPGFRLVIVGGGYIGLEVAAAARKHRLHVIVLEALPRVLARVTAPEVSAFYEAVHRSAGVDIRTGVAVRSAQIDASRDAVVSVTSTDGDVIPGDLFIIGVGLIPNTSLAEDARLGVDNGIIVDEFARTSDPNILAIGDCSNHPNGLYGRRVRIESVPNAQGQARTAASALCGNPQPYVALPWFWSDQYDLKLQIAGLSHDYDRLVIRGNPDNRSFIAFYLRDGKIIAVDSINRPKEFLLAKRLVTEQVSVTCLERLQDESVPLQALYGTSPN
jgi:3-phenylpropionate/trans-cinnamate dioxygenase ferredoxin reductase subunit